MSRTAFANDEGYAISVDSSGVLIAARTAEGVFYGVQTLRQLVTPGAVMPLVQIADWPALRYRSLSVDLNRGPILTEDEMRAAIRTAAEFKMNMLCFYMENVFRYTHAPLPVPEEAQITPEMIRRLAAYARQYHVDLAAHQQFFGHLHNLLKYELYADMGEISHGSVLAPTNEKIYDWIRQSCLELVDAFPSGFLHFGADETWELGEGQSRELARSIGVGGVYLRHMQRIVEMLRPLGKRIVFPSDVVLKHPEIIPELPKDLVVTVWIYSPQESYARFIEPFRKNGMNYFASTALHNWNRPMPDFTRARENVNGFARDAKNMGALGLAVSHWADDGEALFNTIWYGAVFAAAAGWQAGTVDVAGFDDAFDWAFYRNGQDHTFVNAIRGLAEANDLMRSAKVEGGLNDRFFWLDPFSRYGSETVRKAYPVASRVRRLAERAALDLAAARPKALDHTGTIPFLELAAKRIDYAGMKIQFSKEAADSYRAAMANAANDDLVGNNLRRIRGMDGLLPSLRDYINEVKAAYRNTWLMENRPYWLDNVLVRYDAEALYWVQKMRLFESAAEQQEATRALPDPEKLGLFFP